MWASIHYTPIADGNSYMIHPGSSDLIEVVLGDPRIPVLFQLALRGILSQNLRQGVLVHRGVILE